MLYYECLLMVMIPAGVRRELHGRVPHSYYPFGAEQAGGHQ